MLIFKLHNFFKNSYFDVTEILYDEEKIFENFCNRDYISKINGLGIKNKSMIRGYILYINST